MTMTRSTADVYATWFRCLADPTRILILNLLARTQRPMSVGEIATSVDVGQSTVSHHLKILAETRFVVAETRGASTFYAVNERCIECFPSAAELVMGGAWIRARQRSA
jgi:ArsR family transcriptional regulator, arsenate/arsenite/antimonite-responsive transcriptional repressor